MIDLESKLTEADLAVTRLHEAKDFSHGRFISVLDHQPRPAALVVGVGPPTSYEEVLLAILRDHCVAVEMRSPEREVLGACDLLIRGQHFVQELGRSLGRDISRPERIPADGLLLYRWKGPLDNT
jgi:hypothetical protein